MRVRHAAALFFALSTACQDPPAPTIKEIAPVERPVQPTTVAIPHRPSPPGDVKHGWELFREHCTVCHGASRRGTGVYRSKLPVPPADLRDPLLLASHSDDQLAHSILEGVAA